MVDKTRVVIQNSFVAARPILHVVCWQSDIAALRSVAVSTFRVKGTRHLSLPLSRPRQPSDVAGIARLHNLLLAVSDSCGRIVLLYVFCPAPCAPLVVSHPSSLQS